MKLSIVTVTYNRALQFYRGLSTVISQIDARDFPNSIELVIIDDGSKDGTPHMSDLIEAECRKRNIEYKYIYLDYPEPRISCYPRNVGIKQATGDIIIFTEPEALHVGDTIRQLLEKMAEHPDSVILASQVWSMGQRIQEKLTNEQFEKPARIINHEYAMLVEGNMQNTKAPNSDFSITGEKFCNAGVLFLVRKEWLIECGGFDESFTGHGFDDFDLINRLGYLGHPLVKCPDIAVIHQWHRKDYPYNIYDEAQKNGAISEANIKASRYKVNDGDNWGIL